MFRALFKDPKFVGAQTSPPNTVMVIMEDGIENYTTDKMKFRSEASKEVKGTDRGKDKIRELFIEPSVKQKGRFTVTMYEF